MGTGTETGKVQIYRVPSGAFIVKSGKRMYATETQTCESFAKIDEEPADMGKLMERSGQKGVLIFEKKRAKKRLLKSEFGFTLRLPYLTPLRPWLE